MGSVIVASIVSWFGAAIPLVLRTKIGVWAALKRSVELSTGYEWALFLLFIGFSLLADPERNSASSSPAFQ